MDFKKSTDILFSPISHPDLAKALDVSVALIRQARLQKDATAHRSPPPDWQKAVAQLARQQSRRLLRLAEAIEKQ